MTPRKKLRHGDHCRFNPGTHQLYRCGGQTTCQSTKPAPQGSRTEPYSSDTITVALNWVQPRLPCLQPQDQGAVQSLVAGLSPPPGPPRTSAAHAGTQRASSTPWWGQARPQHPSTLCPSTGHGHEEHALTLGRTTQGSSAGGQLALSPPQRQETAHRRLCLLN